MQKRVRVSLFVILIFLILAVSSFGGTLWFSYKNVRYQIGESTVSGYITKINLLPPTYEGHILVDTPLEIDNDGLYNINDLQIAIQVYGQNFSTSILNEELLGEGVNPIGNIQHGTSWSGVLQLNMTEWIALLAVYNGEMRIEVQISFHLDFFIYQQQLNFNQTQVEPWNSPF
ncbi:MAG: hypothetical protein JW776_08440 [Candidatus Lokiarchaeota archaeon]|nr:hypothetical protein [Candidatus Lokiarchaeota archaeon]